jgi:hypothetical protein
MANTLLPNGTSVEAELLALEDIPIAATALARPRRDDGVQPAGLELPLEGSLHLASSLALSVLLLDALALLGVLGGLGALLLPSAADSGAVVGLVPGAEGGGVDLDDGGLGQGVCADELVVGGVVDDADDARLAADALAAPREAAGVEAEGAELAVAAAGADEVDALGADARVGGLAALLESSACRRRWSVIWCVRMHFGLWHIPLLTVMRAFGTGRGALVARIARDTGMC